MEQYDAERHGLLYSGAGYRLVMEHVSRQRKYQILHQRAGLCIKCPEKAVAGRYCQRHHDIERRQRRVRRAMNNSFGFGGTNCTLVLSHFDG